MLTHVPRRAFVFFVAVMVAGAPPSFRPTPEIDHALAAISPDSLRGNLSFLASDLLEGRDTPSRGLDLAAEYIAAQFRCVGLDPAGDDGYFQTAKMLRVGEPGDGFEMRVHLRDGTVTLAKDQVHVVSSHPIELAAAPVFKTDGKIMVMATRNTMQPAAYLQTAEDTPRLIDPDAEEAEYHGIPRIIVRDDEVREELRSAKSGATGITISMRAPASNATTVRVRNVIGLLPGSDPILREQYVLVTAHYDHLGVSPAGAIFHGANDDGSGTVSVIEIAKALAALPAAPKRSIVFMVFFGEEEGSLGSSYYIRHPVFPLTGTVADLNLEQVGRTDSTDGPEIANATLSGFNYSTVTDTLRQAGRSTGVKVYKTSGDEEYFNRSDNQPFAAHGIPAHTIAVAFDYPDYHAPGDIWQKIDYGNMAKVDRMIALAALLLADSRDVPKWTGRRPR